MDGVTPEEMRAAQLIIGLTMAAWVGSRFLGPNAGRLRHVVLGVYLVAVAVTIGYVLVR